MYLSGFSGGSRLASSIASLTDKFAGVVGCGAGFSYVPEQMPAAHTYSYVGLCGDRDMNFKEMHENRDYLKLMKFNSTLITYEDEHKWPPQNQILRAFDWLHLQKLKKEAPTYDQILPQYHADYNLFRQFMATQKLLFAAEQSERMLKDYKHLIQTDSLSKQHSKLLRSKGYKKEKAEFSNALKREIALANRLRSKLFDGFENQKMWILIGGKRSLKNYMSLSKRTIAVKFERWPSGYDLSFLHKFIPEKTTCSMHKMKHIQVGRSVHRIVAFHIQLTMSGKLNFGVLLEKPE